MTRLLTIILIFFSYLGFSQHIKIDRKALSYLKSESKVLVIFDYDSCQFGGDKIKETAFIDQRYKKLEKKNKNTSHWFHAYHNHKEKLWQDAYLKNLNEYLADYDAPTFVLNSEEPTNYTMTVNVLWIYMGYDVGVARSPSKIKLRLDISDSNTKINKSTLFISESRGNNSDDDNDSEWTYLRRVQNAFYNSGFKLAIALKRVFK